jgi:hypothetical protein
MMCAKAERKNFENMCACHSVLQPWVSLGPLYNQSPLLSILHLLFPSFHENMCTTNKINKENVKLKN